MSDFSDEEAVLSEVARELGYDASDLEIGESHMTSFRAGPVYEVSTPGGGRTWLVMEDEDAAESLALAVVTQDLENEPELFKLDFLEDYIDTDRLRRDLMSDVESMVYDDLSDESVDRFWALAADYDLDVPDEDEDGDLPDPNDSVIEELAEEIAKDRLSDPIGYLVDMYGREDALKQAMEIAGIDIDAAAQAAVGYDGWPHFICRYDGNYDTTKSGFVFWRE